MPTRSAFVCGAFECCENVRRTPPPQFGGFDIERAMHEGIAGLAERARRFAAIVVGTHL
ncbi:hypothetical protein [Leifsonia xyli]|uniref:hypothetical protein n=1 Tax=Leifsonia xyli TaxID=1575 RepID=UPI000300E816